MPSCVAHWSILDRHRDQALRGVRPGLRQAVRGVAQRRNDNWGAIAALFCSARVGAVLARRCRVDWNGSRSLRSGEGRTRGRGLLAVH